MALVLAATALHLARRCRLVQAELRQSQADLARTATERDVAAAQALAQGEYLQSLQSLAEVQFPQEPPERRLPLLLRKVKIMTRVTGRLAGRRYLDTDAAGRLDSKVQGAPAIDVEIDYVWQDEEAAAFAQELHAAFTHAGLQPRPLAQYMPSANLPTGVAVYSRHQLNEVFGKVVAQIFAEAHQEPVQWLDEDFGGPTASPAGPELKIVVGSR